jgi:hypothetical protein
LTKVEPEFEPLKTALSTDTPAERDDEDGTRATRAPFLVVASGRDTSSSSQARRSSTFDVDEARGLLASGKQVPPAPGHSNALFGDDRCQDSATTDGLVVAGWWTSASDELLLRKPRHSLSNRSMYFEDAPASSSTRDSVSWKRVSNE